jgi:hypothetical protein
MSADKLENLLKPNKNSDLANLIERAKSMGALTETLAAALPSDFAGSIAAANVRDDGLLVVIGRTPAWSARLRFESETLIRAASSTGAKISGCTVKVSQQN